MVMNYPKITKEPGQRSINLDEAYLARVVPPWSRPATYPAEAWRNLVLMQPIALVCRETLVANLLSLDWKISARDSNMRDELSPTIKYYTRLFETGNYDGTDFTNHVEWIATDMLDLPFGGASEVGRKGDAPGGRVAWVKPLDGGTLYPTLNKEFPVVQYYMSMNPVAFPAHAIDRIYISPRTELIREGWGMAPPEKIFLAMEMLLRGDRYYANLLLDVPPAGILDLGDMEQTAALDWVKSFRTLLSGGIDGFKIPVLYEHNNEVKFLSLGQVPNNIMFDSITMRYAAIIAAGYGMSLSDIGFSQSSNGGDTMAGSIRQERKTRRTGFARAKKKMAAYFNALLPAALQFGWIDYDDELNVAVGRARLANTTAFGQAIDKEVFTPDEARQQMIADGLVTISIPEKMPEAEKKKLAAAKKSPERPGVLGATPVAPSSGGQGEARSLGEIGGSKMSAKVLRIVKETSQAVIPLLVSLADALGEDEMYEARSIIDRSVLRETDDIGLHSIIKGIVEKRKNQIHLELEDGLKDISGLDFAVTNSVAERSVLALRDAIFADDTLDTVLDEDYDNIVRGVHAKVMNDLEQIANSCLDAQIALRDEMEE